MRFRSPFRVISSRVRFRIDSDVRLRPERQFHLLDLSAVALLVAFFRDSVERVDCLVRQRRGGFRLLTHLRATPPFRRSRSRPLPPPPLAALPPRPRTPRNSVPSRRAGVPRRSRAPG